MNAAKESPSARTARVLSVRQRLAAATIGFGYAVLMATAAQADVNIATAPLFVSPAVAPNVLFVLDDSGSMQWETMDDSITKRFGGTLEGSSARAVMWMFPRTYSGIHGGSSYNNQRTIRFDDSYWSTAMYRSSAFNTVYYNPAVTYRPWVNADGTEMDDAPPEAAPNRPLFVDEYGVRNLTIDNTQTAWWVNDGGGHTTESQTFYPALYYHYDGGSATSTASYTRVEIRSSQTTYSGHGRENRTDCSAGVCTYDQEIQNFANWYSYHRSRIFASRAGIGRAFSLQPESLRVGYGTINKGSSTIDGASTSIVVRGVREFTGTDRTAFFNSLYTGAVPTNSTPLRLALKGAGNYFGRSDDQGPWSSTPGVTGGGAHLTCRQNFTILMSDGYWSGGSPSVGNSDNAAGDVIPRPTGASYQYTASDPYRDGHSNTLADVAMQYWKTDLRSDLANRVPTTARDPAFWQHMVTYGIGLGVQGAIDPADAWAAVDAGTAISWPNPTSSDAAKIDDLLHAAINGRGGFFSASDAETFGNELAQVLDDIVARVESSATSAATSSAVFQTDTLLYTAGFRSEDWSGTFAAYEVYSDGSLSSGPMWDAETQLAGTPAASRNILAVNSATNAMVPFAHAQLSAEQRTALDHGADDTNDGLGAERITWLRGSDSAHASFRSRGGRVLGDIVSSNPQFLGKRDLGYGMMGIGEASGYGAYISSIADRPNVIFVGANDGMLHAFNAETGVELFAFIPSELLLAEAGRNHAPLSRLMDPEYQHRFFMDGTVMVSDAYINGQWRTVLVGTMGAGGRTVFALDVTNPENPSLLWEFRDDDLGYNVGQPTIARMRNGQWAAIFGNGYNSANHHAALFVVNLANGVPLAKIDTGVGSSGSPNGLGAPVVTDWPATDVLASRIYAGDLQGNLWRFDVSDVVASTWTDATNRAVLYTARDSSNAIQQITARPAVAPHPDFSASTLVVNFGTGSYFQSGDAASTQTQSMYGIFDTASGTTVSGRAQLLQQTITSQTAQSFDSGGGDQYGYTVRTVSSNALDITTDRGWFLDLSVSGVVGERVVNPPSFPAGTQQSRVRFSTLVPDNDACGSARRGFLMDIDLRTGGSRSTSVFDLNVDEEFDEDDMVGGEVISGVEFAAGETLTSIRERGANREVLFSGDGDESLSSLIDGQGGRQSWRQLR